MKDISLCTPIIIGCQDHINQMTFDGCAYYGTLSGKCAIVKLNECMEIEEIYPTWRAYDSICYDCEEHCFWVSSKDCGKEIFRLDCGMNEIDSIHLEGIGFTGIITGISYHCCKHKLLLSYASGVAEVDKTSGTSSPIYSVQQAWIMGLLSLCPGTILLIMQGDRQYLRILNEQQEVIRSYCVGDCYSLKNLIWNPCGSRCRRPKIEAFVLKRFCYPYLCEWDGGKENLGFLPCPCNNKICQACCCDEKPCPEDACADILESIALIEAALSHILNAEGEKLQKVLSTSDDLDKILCVNREVNQTIVSATHLEHVLHDKLRAITDYCS